MAAKLIKKSPKHSSAYSGFILQNVFGRFSRLAAVLSPATHIPCMILISFADFSVQAQFHKGIRKEMVPLPYRSKIREIDKKGINNCLRLLMYTTGTWEKANHVYLGCLSKLVSIRKNRNWNRNLFRHYPKQNVCFGCFASIPKQRVSMFRLNRNKQKTNRNSVIGSIFCNFLQKI